METGCKPSAKLLRAILLTALVPLMAACGGSSSTPSASTPAGHLAAEEAAAVTSAKTHRDVVTSGVVVHRPLHGTGGDEINDDNPGKADTGEEPAAGQSNPCKLVSAAEAQAIVGRPVAPPQEAPLGPTCIYQPLGAKSFITVAVEAVALAQVLPHVQNRTRFKVRGKTAYCGDYGQATTFVALSGGRVLNITAPCGVGRLFALEALSRLTA